MDIDSSTTSFTVSKKHGLSIIPESSSLVSSPRIIPQDSPISQFNEQNIITDKDGNECTVLQYQIDDDILKDIDLEKSIGSEVMKRLQYRVDKATVNVLIILYMIIQ